MSTRFTGLDEALIDLDSGFGQLLDNLGHAIGEWTEGTIKQLRDEFIRLSFQWHAEASKRVPVDTGTLRKSLQRAGGLRGNELYAEVSTSTYYAAFIEFGTIHIAGGRVKALGTGAYITDSQAVKSWPALEARGGKRQQMPWLRPAFWAIREEFQQRLVAAMHMGRIGIGKAA